MSLRTLSVSLLISLKGIRRTGTAKNWHCKELLLGIRRRKEYVGQKIRRTGIVKKNKKS